MFLKIPNQDLYGDNDLAKYKAILLSTNAHKQKYLRDGQINANRSYKYANIIAKLFPTEHRETTKAKLTKTLTPKLSRRRIQSVIGSGWKKTVTSPVQYIYWNSCDELVDRLRELVAEKEAGNNSKFIHNEILNIIQELREEGIIG